MDVSSDGREIDASINVGFEVPCFKAIAEEIRRGRLAKNTNHAVNNGSENTDEKEDSDFNFQSKPVKILKLENGQQAICEDEEKQRKQLLLVSEHESRRELLKLLKKFLKCAFTIIIKKRKLCPSDAFQMTTMWGVKVPRFLHPSSLEYVEEVSKKLILFLHRNSTEGCVIHIMIEKNKTLHVVQRFVFRIIGSMDDPKKEGKETQYINIDGVKTHCKSSLLQLLNSDAIKPMSAPQYSRWSISIGLNEEFIDGEEVDELWSNDPSGHYFPWKKKQRGLANTQRSGDNNYTLKDSIPSSPSQHILPEIVEGTTDCNDTSNAESPICEDDKQLTSKQEEPINDTSILAATCSTSSLRNDKRRIPYNEACKIICFPLSSFPITSNSMISIYGLNYMAPVNNFILSPRAPRSIPSVSLRLSQFRNRMMRPSNNKF